MRASVVICTYNRAAGLDATLQSLRHQRYRDFEVVVVNGPSTDATESVLTTYADDVKVARCPLPNLSMSRNIGIRAAAGDVVAFIDDDALPEFEWLATALAAFVDPEVGGVGGIVFDHTGMNLQYRFSAADRFGNARAADDQPFDDWSVPGSAEFPYLQGTNALFRRPVLEEVGGFDETFDYFLDETDLCCRIVDAGYVLRQVDGAPVHHKFLPSGTRNHHRVVTNWYPMVKNHVYFGFRHAGATASPMEIVANTQRFIDRCLVDVAHHEQFERLPAGATESASTTMGNALLEGITRAQQRGQARLARLPPAPDNFRPYPTVPADARLAIVIVAGDYPPRITGGIARYLGDVAPALARRGHEVRVITRRVDPADDIGTVDLEDGVWVHRVPPAPSVGIAPDTLPHVNEFVTASAHELRRIASFAPVDVVYGPVWDADVYGALRRSPHPVVAMLATPIFLAVDTDDPDPRLAALLELEREVIRQADRLHAISASILDTVAERFAELEVRAKATVAAIGVSAPAPTSMVRAKPNGGVRVLYVGRLEPRKGVDVLLRAIERIAPDHGTLTFDIVGLDNEVGTDGTSPTSRWRDQHRGAHWFERIEFRGAVAEAELVTRYRRADVVVVPSRYESFGLVAVEAMMHGCPVIVSDIGGLREVVRDGVDGLRVQPGDAPALANAIVTLATQPGLRSEMGAAARRRYLDDLSIERAAESLELLLRAEAHRRPDDLNVETGSADLRGGVHDLGPRDRLMISSDGAWTLPMIAESGTRLLAADERGSRVLQVEGRTVVSSTDDGVVTLEVIGGRAWVAHRWGQPAASPSASSLR